MWKERKKNNAKFSGHYVRPRTHAQSSCAHENNSCICRFVGIGVEGEKRPDGWGEMEYTTGSQYTGQWTEGVREGCGVIVTKGYLSTRYSGAWKQDKQTGKTRSNHS